MTMMYPGMTNVVDTSSPEGQFASHLRNWLTTYAQESTKAAQYVQVAYARGYLQSWPPTGLNGIMPEDLNMIIDLLNEFVTELGEDDKTLINRLRTDV